MNKLAILLLLAASTNISVAEELKDPHTRDESISGTVVTADVTQLDNGLYQYVYRVGSPATNKGTIIELSIDVSCAGAPAVDLGLPMATSYSDDGNHLPVSLSAAYGNA